LEKNVNIIAHFVNIAISYKRGEIQQWQRRKQRTLQEVGFPLSQWHAVCSVLPLDPSLAPAIAQPDTSIIPLHFETPLASVLRTTPEFLRTLEVAGIRTVRDFALYLPRAHEDIASAQTLATAPLGEKVTLRGTVTELKSVRTRSRMTLVQARFTDAEDATAQVVWFNQPHILRMIADGDEVTLTGKLALQGRKLQFVSPTFEHAVVTPPMNGGRLVPAYSQIGPITSRWFREKMPLIRDALPLLPETLPKDVLEDEKLPSLAETVEALHFPVSAESVARARERLAFESLYGVQCDALERKRQWQGTRQERLKIPMDVELIREFFASLRFTPTDSQRIAIYEILRDLEKDVPMSRLLEGDVGSGKTLVAVAVMACVVRHGCQCGLMVPTEVLARQHAQTITRLLLNLREHLLKHQRPTVDFSVALLTGSTPLSESRDIKSRLATGTLDIVIGTHALLEDDVRFRNLSLVIVDEQHRFGVLQRARFTEKGSPHFLSMTATPIPRTLALTAYGDHDLSVLLEKPGNRRPIATRVVAPSDRRTVEAFIDHSIGEGRQVFVICPLITASEADEMQDIRNVEAEAKRLREAFPHRRIALLHGRMPPAEKEEVMAAFKARASDILVSTAVIEVGIDVPNATIIVIEGAERFGLAQLHQFRGRVGRGEHASHCFLFATTPAQARSPRLKAMEEHDSGFMLAEIDLKLRGPGELFGLQQSGIPESALQSMLSPELVVRARRAAEKNVGLR
jgi:ATP-dependent DNA helicase RecG